MRLFKVFSNNCYQIFPVAIVGKFTCLAFSFLGCWRFVCCGLFSWCFLGCWRFVCCGLFSWCFLGCWRFVCCGLFSWCFLAGASSAAALQLVLPRLLALRLLPLQLVLPRLLALRLLRFFSWCFLGCWRLFSWCLAAGFFIISPFQRSCAFWPGSAFLGLFLVFLSKIPAASKNVTHDQ